MGRALFNLAFLMMLIVTMRCFVDGTEVEEETKMVKQEIPLTSNNEKDKVIVCVSDNNCKGACPNTCDRIFCKDYNCYCQKGSRKSVDITLPCALPIGLHI
ncbi:hypothetical protein JCGZ_23424 [Jatropha curcas]|uniref:Uncharacterized protein n=1 Tax=Jatropha curcas TaxID=180498 RepID=A0A067JI16_JATCU|nr:uncharacterized protein LOC105647617 [Jatropha curcas]KDP23591.1 hypothetical protein JCGZ_23424 [Jatropha curcas]